MPNLAAPAAAPADPPLDVPGDLPALNLGGNDTVINQASVTRQINDHISVPRTKV